MDLTEFLKQNSLTASQTPTAPQKSTYRQGGGPPTAAIPKVTTIDPTFFLGVDLGQRTSHSAFIVLERFDEMPAFTDMLRGVGPKTRYVVRQAERVPLGMPYHEVIGKLKGMVTRIKERGICIVVVDESGAGIPIVELMRKELACNVVGITITSGKHATPGNVPRSSLITKMQVMAEREELEIAAHCRDIEALEQELASLTLSKSSQTDDLALALCLACWRAKPR